jgi:hypothetical protein
MERTGQADATESSFWLSEGGIKSPPQKDVLCRRTVLPLSASADGDDVGIAERRTLYVRPPARQAASSLALLQGHDATINQTSKRRLQIVSASGIVEDNSEGDSTRAGPGRAAFRAEFGRRGLVGEERLDEREGLDGGKVWEIGNGGPEWAERSGTEPRANREGSNVTLEGRLW